VVQNKIIKVGLIGLGSMGQNHLRILSMLKNVELVFIYDTNQKLAERLAQSYRVKLVENLNTALTTVEAVIISTPTVTHADYIRKAAECVRNIFVEKPLAYTFAESKVLQVLAEERGLNIQVGFIERFNPAVQQMKRIMDKSRQVVSVDFTRTNKLSSRITDVDVVIDMMIHDIDLALTFNGPIITVVANGVCEGEMIDFASAFLTHTNGRFSRVQASRITEKKIRSIQATCKDMFIDCDLLRKEIVISRQSELQQIEGEPYSISALEEMVQVPPQEALLSELQAFIASCTGEVAIDRPNVYDGLNAMHICDQIQKKVRQ
jgi:predicted dehydrogenase